MGSQLVHGTPTTLFIQEDRTIFVVCVNKKLQNEKHRSVPHRPACNAGRSRRVVGIHREHRQDGEESSELRPQLLVQQLELQRHPGEGSGYVPQEMFVQLLGWTVLLLRTPQVLRMGTRCCFHDRQMLTTLYS